MKAHFYSPMGLRGDHLVTLFNPLTLISGSRQESGFGDFKVILTPILVCIHVFMPASLIFFESGAHATPPLFHSNFEKTILYDYWMGDHSSFRLTFSRNQLPLKLDAPAESGQSWMATKDTFSGKVREWIIHQDFTPSNNNRSFFFLNASTSNLEAEHLSGMAIRTGENGNPKHFRLIAFDQGRPGNTLWNSDISIKPETSYRIRVLQSPGNDLHFYIAEGVSDTPLLQLDKLSLSALGDGPDAAHIRDGLTGHFGIKAHYTSTRSDQFYFGDIVISDTYPEPEIADIEILGSEINILFSIPPDSAERDHTLFSINDGSYSFDIEWPHPQICTLQFEQPPPPGEYTLRISSYRTMYNQISEPETKSFIVPHTAEKGDVAINEFMYDPPEDVPEYAELYNHTDNVFNLKNWRLQRRNIASETDRYITRDDLLLHPGEYLILTSQSDALKHTMHAENVFEMPDFPRLNRASADKLRLFSENNILIDSLQYTPSSWGGTQVALERKSPTVPGWLYINWDESIAATGGTPGYSNSVSPPVATPELIGLEYSSESRIILEFDRILMKESATDPENYKLTNKSTGLAISLNVSLPSPSKVILDLDQPLSHGSAYKLNVTGVSDLFENIIKPIGKTFHYYRTHQPTSGDIVINEILYRPGDNPAMRFIELKNISEHVVDLRGWKLGRQIGNPVTFIEEDNRDPLFLLPEQKAVISEKGMIITYPVNIHISMPSFPSFSRFGDSAFIISSAGITIDSVAYKPEWGGNKDGISLERVEPDGASLDPDNWAEHPESHTAGRRNNHFNKNPEPPKAKLAKVEHGRTIRILFDKFVDSKSINEITIENRRLPLSDSETLPQYRSLFRFSDGDSIHRLSKQITITGFRDFSGRLNSGQTIDLAYPPETGDLIINEIMYQPLSERYSSKYDQSEYLEIYNKAIYPVVLEGLHLHDRPDKNGVTRSLMPEGITGKSLESKSFAVFHADTSESLKTSRIYHSFSLPQNHFQHFYRIDRLTLGFSTQGDEVYLSDISGEIIDSIWYDPSWHNPDVIDPRGISLERIHAGVRGQNPGNWSSNTDSEGGTPGYNNSVAALTETERSTGLYLEPNPFSPNGDGENDHLVITYQLDQSYYLSHVRIFDRKGRLVRTLVDGKRAGYSGKLIWDGRDDNGVMSRVGLYIVHFDAYSSIGNSLSFREIAVLAIPL